MPDYPPIPAEEFARLVDIVRRLRVECPWDREQTHRSISQSLIEETYEVVEALDNNNLEELRNELGDLLLHIVMHSAIAEQGNEFGLADVIDGISNKLVRRHPHVFGDVRAPDSEHVLRNWETLKMAEGRTSLLEGIPKHLPALQRALKMQERAAKVGFDWKRESDVWAKVVEEGEELRSALGERDLEKRTEEFGDFLFALVNYARFMNINPETALRVTIEKFDRRFRFIEQSLQEQGKDIHNSTLDEMDGLWNSAKSRGM